MQNQPNTGGMLSAYQEQTQRRVGSAIERLSPTRPKTSEIWKNDGSFDGTSVTKSEFTLKQGERYDTVRPSGIQSWITNDDNRTFQRETSNMSDYSPKTVERYEPSRPADSTIFKVLMEL